MTRRLPNLNALRVFEAAARHLSFSRAAEELAVTQGAVSHQVRAMEEYLGVALFKRRGRAVELTEQGRDYFAITRDAFELVEQASRRIMEGTRRTLLTVSVLPTFAMSWLIPRLSQFSRDHPDVEVHMITSILPVNFERDDIDVAIRVGVVPSNAQPSDLPRIDLQMVDGWTKVRADKLMADVLIPVGSPGLLQQTPIETAQDLMQLGLIHNATRVHAWPDWFRAQGIAYQPTSKETSFGHFFMCIQAAIEGRGVALIPSALLGDNIAAGRLRVAFDRPIESAGAYYLLCRTQQWNTDRIRRFREWLLSASQVPVEKGDGQTEP